ncbi:helix-turn-helix transcriptional regulator [Actinokineospora terrae]|uniref:AAA ATPase domain-containing protein n=1 Tax=Actinokineospora terrae TaxID=155974 RepID=A0A1H9VHT5_9PSEU|nr:LuxR C-terminal-related transcriptional regulator [Actinokineospora terrae]SES21265.1 AAA ATPase domain-containing protein [Actinokineospora terrae]
MTGVLVQRRAELVTAVGAVRAAGAPLHVVGGAGHGKTRFVDELLADPAVRDRRVVRGVCQPPSVGAFAYGPVVDGLRVAVAEIGAVRLNPVVGVLRAVLPEVAELLPPMPDCVDEATARHLVFRAVRELLVALAPVVLVVEDAHWADEDTRALLRFLTSTVADRVAVVLTYRPGCGSLGVPGTRVDLAPFTREELDPLVPDADALLAHTGGVPYLVAAGFSVPVAAYDDVATRLDGVCADARAVVVAAAVVDVPVSTQVLARIGGVSGGRDAVVAALRTGVLVEHAPDAFRVANGVFRRVVYDELTGPERVESHRRALRALRGMPGVSPRVLAEHARLGGRLGEWVEQVEAVIAAARDSAVGAGGSTVATGDSAVVEAIEPLLAEPALPAADLCRLAVRYAGVVGAEGLPVLTKLVGDARLTESARAEVRLGRGLLLVRAGVYEGVGEVRRAVAGLRPEVAARGMVVLAAPTLGSRSLEENLEWMDRSERVLARYPEGPGRTTLLAAVATNRLHTADPVAWDMLAMVPAQADAADHRAIAEAACWIGHRDLARAHLRRAPGPTALVLDFHSGHWSGLAARAASSRSAEGALVLAWLALATGDWEGAEQNLAAISADAIVPVLLAAHATAIRMWLHRDRSEEVDDAVKLGLGLLRDKGNWAWAGEILPAAVTALCRLGRLDDARGLVAELLRCTASMNLPSTVADECRGLVAEAEGDVETAAAHYLLARQDSPRYTAARHAESAARCRLRTHRTAATADLLTLVDTLEHLGATLDANRCRHLLRDNGSIPHLRRGRRSYGDQLSPRERDVVRLLAQHRSNQDIADVLFLSRRTVEQHVANVLRKLHLDSRHEVARAFPDTLAVSRPSA